MLADASNPRIFSEVGLFGTDEDVMVSIAPSRAGFPLHAHGRSWMVRQFDLCVGVPFWSLLGLLGLIDFG